MPISKMKLGLPVLLAKSVTGWSENTIFISFEEICRDIISLLSNKWTGAGPPLK